MGSDQPKAKSNTNTGSIYNVFKIYAYGRTQKCILNLNENLERKKLYLSVTTSLFASISVKNTGTIAAQRCLRVCPLTI